MYRGIWINTSYVCFKW
uniref:Uncharacterized protein n=1 Tax=Arundo donax TaxID=35708 RepID=A0A0A9HK64_ARUDO